ncbi:2095_t:CDS:1, partial [Scutellospora calospora]
SNEFDKESDDEGISFDEFDQDEITYVFEEVEISDNEIETVNLM